MRNICAVAILTLASSALAGCTTLGSRAVQDPIVTSSVGTGVGANTVQGMPGQLNSSLSSSAKYLPPADVGAQRRSEPVITNSISAPTGQNIVPQVVRQDLPILNSSPAAGRTPIMPAQLSTPTTQAIPDAIKATPTAVAAQAGSGYAHVIESGESLYAIARRYNVSTDTLVLANGLVSPDKIFVGQKIIVPGAQNLPAQSVRQPVAVDTTVTSSASAPVAPNLAQRAPVVLPQAPSVVSEPQPVAVATTTPPATTGTFRWPVSGKVITDFPASKGTGINIEVPEGTAVRAAGNGQVIYVGDAVEGYGNLILIRHDNGFVSAYAHLSQATVSKGTNVARGDVIGNAGMTGSVNKPQLHFELRKGATPVDPVPLLAS